MEILYGAKNGDHAFGYNSAEVNPLWAHCWGLALADFGRDPRSSDSLRGSGNFFGQVINARFPVWQIFTTYEHNNVDRWGGENFRSRILKIAP